MICIVDAYASGIGEVRSNQLTTVYYFSISARTYDNMAFWNIRGSFMMSPRDTAVKVRSDLDHEIDVGGFTVPRVSSYFQESLTAQRSSFENNVTLGVGSEG